MFSVVKVREGLARDDYRDPGWYRHPPGTVAYEYTGADLPAAPQAHKPGAKSQAHSHSQSQAAGEISVSARKPGHRHGH